MRALCCIGVGLLAGCAESAQEHTAAAAAVEPVLIADFRAGPTALAPQANGQARIDALFGTPAPSDAQVVAEISGSFTSAERVQTAALVTRAPVPGRDAKPSMLAVFEQGQVVAQFVTKDVVYRDIAGVLDADRDGRDDLVLVAPSYQMGQVRAVADVVSVAGGQRRVLLEIGAVYESTCDVPVGERAVQAVTLARQADAQIIATTYTADCRDDGNPPAPAAFTATAAARALPQPPAAEPSR